MISFLLVTKNNFSLYWGHLWQILLENIKDKIFKLGYLMLGLQAKFFAGINWQSSAEVSGVTLIYTSRVFGFPCLVAVSTDFIKPPWRHPHSRHADRNKWQCMQILVYVSPNWHLCLRYFHAHWYKQVENVTHYSVESFSLNQFYFLAVIQISGYKGF